MKRNQEGNTVPNEKKIEGLLSPKAQLGQKIDSVFLGLDSNFNILLLVGQDNYSSVILPLFGVFSKQKDRLIIFVGVNKPFEKIKSELLSGGLPLHNTVFIDMVTSMVGAKKLDDKNVVYLPETASLNDLIDAIQHELEQKTAKTAVLLFDSVSTMLVYNDSLPVEKMVHSLIGKLDKFGVDGVFLMVESKEFSGTTQIISQFCDRVVEVEKL